MKIIEKNVSELIPYENNPRNNDDAVEKVAASIKEFGFKVPIVIDSNNVIVAGHTRLRAAQQLELKKVPVIVADDLSEEQIKAFRLADNKTSEFASWDLTLLDQELGDIGEIDMSDFGFDDPLDIDWDSVPELSEKEYQPPEHQMLECPNCHHVDRDIRFKKV